ncbi:MAG: flagellar basal body-associated FliL family protein [Thermodesulfobacteriota bacterium]
MVEKSQGGTSNESEAAGAGKKKASKLPVLVLLVAVLAAGGGFFGWTQLKGSASQTPEKASPPPPPPVVSIKPFVVNLQDPGDIPRYLKLEFDVELRPGSQVKELETRMSELRDAVIVLLGSKRSADLATVEGKERLRDEIITRINSRLQNATANRVFFKEFIIQ